MAGINVRVFRTLKTESPPLLETRDVRVNIHEVRLPVHFVVALGRSEVYLAVADVTCRFFSLRGWRVSLSELELETLVVRVFAHLPCPPSWVRVGLVVGRA